MAGNRRLFYQRRGGWQDCRFQRHRLIVIEKFFADAEKIRLCRDAPDFVQELCINSFADEVHEFLHALHLRQFTHVGRDFARPQLRM